MKDNKKPKRRVGRPTELVSNSPETKIHKSVSMKRKNWEDLDSFCQDSGENRSQIVEKLIMKFLG